MALWAPNIEPTEALFVALKTKRLIVVNKTKSVLPEGLTEILSQYFFNLSSKEISTLFDATEKDNLTELDISEFQLFETFFNYKVDNIKNVGFDFPLHFPNIGKGNLAIVALESIRNDKNKINKGKVSIGSVFSLQNPLNRETDTNDYWKLIGPLTQSFNIYLTDLFKIYFEDNGQNPEKKNIRKRFKELSIATNPNENFHSLILKKELEYFFNSFNNEENIILTLGKEAATAISTMYQINRREDEVFVCQNNIKFIFMPHISRTVTQNIKTVSRLYVAIGKLKNVRKNDGDKFKLVRSQILDLKEELFS